MQKTPNYRAGYDDGCAAASTMGANPRGQPYRDDALYESDQAYRAGWSSGFATCRNQTMGGSLPGNSLSPIPGQH
ncbi:MAG: hypothetical protein JO056_09580 [Alphaproteobacteria bacterium]|nr:hypothetical protein [Alphaproteobacteria bacterium]